MPSRIKIQQTEWAGQNNMLQKQISTFLQLQSWVIKIEVAIKQQVSLTLWLNGNKESLLIWIPKLE